LEILLHYILVSSEERAKFARRFPVRARKHTHSPNIRESEHAVFLCEIREQI